MMNTRAVLGPVLGAAVIGWGALLFPHPLAGQLTLDPPGKRLRAGETIVVVLPLAEGGQRGGQIESLLFDDQPVPFEILAPRASDGATRLQLRVPATVRPGSHEITVLFARVRVPEVVGLPIEQARRRLAAAGLTLDLEGFRPREVEGIVERVARQRPPAGARVSAGSQVTVEIAGTSEVPDLRGLDLEEARRRLAARGLELAPPAMTATGTDRPLPWKVLEHDPPAGATAPTGSTIAVEGAVEVPDLVGKPLPEVVSTLWSLGLRLEARVREPGAGPFHTALEQDLPAGRLVAPGTGVAVAFESVPTPPAPSWLADSATARWPWLAVAGLLSALLGQMVRARRLLARSYRVEPHLDLAGLRAGSAPPRWADRELGVDLRLRGRPDPGRQTLEVDGSLLSAEAPAR